MAGPSTKNAATDRLASAVPPKKDKRTAILDAALLVFAEYGLHGVSVPEIARKAGVATGSIYRYFNSKADLVNRLYRREKAIIVAHLFEGFDRQAGRDHKAVFDAYWERVVLLARERPDTYRFLEFQNHRPYLDEESLRTEKAVLAPMAAHIRSLQDRGVYRSDVSDRVLMAMMWGAVMHLFKSERDGHLTLRAQDLIGARELCWQLYTGTAAPTASSSRGA